MEREEKLSEEERRVRERGVRERGERHGVLSVSRTLTPPPLISISFVLTLAAERQPYCFPDEP